MDPTIKEDLCWKRLDAGRAMSPPPLTLSQLALHCATLLGSFIAIIVALDAQMKVHKTWGLVYVSVCLVPTVYPLITYNSLIGSMDLLPQRTRNLGALQRSQVQREYTSIPSMHSHFHWLDCCVDHNDDVLFAFDWSRGQCGEVCWGTLENSWYVGIFHALVSSCGMKIDA